MARWNVERPAFRAAYEEARATRTLVWGEQCLDIVDNATGDYVKNPKTGKLEFNHENVHRAKLRVEERHWQMARLDPRLWGERQQIDVRNDWNFLTEQERRRKADELIAMIRELRAEPMQPPPLLYRPEEAPDGEEENGGGIGS